MRNVPKKPTAHRKRKAGMGSAKGAAFEREMAKRFSLWVSGGKSSDLLWRSAGSGGRSTMRRKQTGKGIEYHASDIAQLHPDAAPFSDVFTLECKFYASLELRQVIYDWGSSRVAKWWTQAQRDAASVKRIPLMVIKENNKPPLLVIPATFSWVLQSAYSAPPHVHVTAPSVYIVDLASVLSSPFHCFKGHYVPHIADKRSASDRQRTRRVSLVGV